MFLSGYIFTFVIGVAVGFLFAANMIHSGLDQSTLAD
jgi:tetrahydromethanopterin S-methyltransferase subunit F